MTSVVDKKGVDIASLIIAISVFLQLKPFFTWGMSSYITFGLIPALYTLAILPNMDLKNSNNIVVFLAFFVLLLFLILIQRYSIAYSMFVLSLSIIPFLNDVKLQKSIRYFEIILAVFFGGGVFFWLLVMAGMPIPSHYIPPLNEEFIYGYTTYPPFLVINNGADGFIRFCGPFDEPGIVGTVSVLVLYIERYNLRKRTTLVIFIAACLSLSFMFVVCSLLFVLFNYTKKPSMGLLVLLLVASFYFVTKDNAVLQDRVYNRFRWDASSGKLEGDNRYSEAQLLYVASIAGTSDFYFGDHGKSDGDFFGSRSILDAIIGYGFIFCLLYVFWFIAYARSKRLSWYSTFIFMVLLLINLYQRPNFLSFAYIFLYSSCIRCWAVRDKSLYNG